MGAKNELLKLVGFSEQLARVEEVKAAELEKLEAELLVETKAETVLMALTAMESGKLGLLIMEGLKVIYGSRYKFRRKDKSILVECDGVESDLVGGHGGGVVDVVSLLYRIIAVSQGKGGTLKTLILDEPMKMVDNKTIFKASNFIKSVITRLGLNVLIVTHRQEFIEDADVVYKLGKVNGRTVLLNDGFEA